MELVNKRKEFVDYIKNQLMGEKLPGNKLNGIFPLDRFFTGYLFPIFESESGLDISGEDGNNEKSDTEEKEVESVKKEKRYIPPSSAGFSFFISGEEIKLRVFYNATVFIPDKKKEFGHIESWEKVILGDDGREVVFSPSGSKQFLIFDRKAKIDALWRKHGQGYIVTISLSNNQRIPDQSQQDPKVFKSQQNEKTLFEVEFKCIVESGNIDEYPSVNKDLLNDEEKEIELRYKDNHIYAIGHGVAANWGRNKQGQMEIWTDFMPMVEVPQVTANTKVDDTKVLEFAFLKQRDNHDVINKLSSFVSNYEKWLEKQKHKSTLEDKDNQETASRIIKNIETANRRMKKGIELLKIDEGSRTAFALMNEAMLMQWISNDAIMGIHKDESSYEWRPFQLAFILMVLESTINENSHFRDTLDLIWFPTGGGKTEAYLGLMVFLFVYRRIKYPSSSGGTVAMMRYTLRLLTTQQFLRANKVIFALELIRRKNQSILGKETFTCGLWLGKSTSPNTFKQAREILEDQKLDKLTLKSCPWCGDLFQLKNFVALENDFHFICTNSHCDFGKENNNKLPCNIVDEDLYKNPPSLLIATVDKFARLVWEERAESFFGRNGNRAPELIIQDELHLISSALGSIVGLYEVGIDTAIISRGMRAKYIASTATIKNAHKQVQNLFAKETKVFPAPGLRYDDSYFAKTVPLEKKPGRLYVGYLAPLLNRQNCLAPLAAALMSAPVKLFKNEEQYLDKWWTQIVYHGSLKGVGNSRTLFQSGVTDQLARITLENLKKDIEILEPGFLGRSNKNLKSIGNFITFLKSELGNDDQEVRVQKIVRQYIPVRDIDVRVLTSQQTAEENAHIFDNLALQKHENDSIDVALATNMISVGLDVPRLALMTVNGQPLTTAEYIQASSRVGRGETPGIVFINYYKTQARSLSHYESFRSYHDSFYRFVEPSSLTPFTHQARTRALHAALIIAIRFGDTGLLKNSTAGDFNKDTEVIKKIIKELKIRCDLAIGKDQEARLAVHKHLDEHVDTWHIESEYCRKNRIRLVYHSNDRAFNNLICNFDEKNGVWPTLQSMRSVEKSALMKLVGGVRKVE
jgi:hypothetical protein